MKSLFKETDSNKEFLITKLTRPISFWVVLVVFIVLLFLNSFGLIHTEDLYLQILKEVLITMTVFYFTIRGIEKISNYKYNQKKLDDSIDMPELKTPELND